MPCGNHLTNCCLCINPAFKIKQCRNCSQTVAECIHCNGRQGIVQGANGQYDLVKLPIREVPTKEKEQNKDKDIDKYARRMGREIDISREDKRPLGKNCLEKVVYDEIVIHKKKQH